MTSLVCKTCVNPASVRPSTNTAAGPSCADWGRPEPAATGPAAATVAPADHLAGDLADTADRFRQLGQLTTAALLVAAAVHTARAEAALDAIDPAACLAREVDRVAPGWRVELADAIVRMPPMSCPRCGTLSVLLEWPLRRRCMPGWREINAETLAEGHGRHPGVGEAGSAEVTVLRQHAAWRCDRARGALDLDALNLGTDPRRRADVIRRTP